MVERFSDKLIEFLGGAVGREVSLQFLRTELRIEPGSPEYDNLRQMMNRLSKDKGSWGSLSVKASGRHDGVYKVYRRAKPVSVFGVKRDRREPFMLKFPQDHDTGEEMIFSDSIVIREGDVITIGGQSNFGKTALAISFCGENIDHYPVIMGNEYTTRAGDTEEYEPTARFLSRLDNMDWVEWSNGDGMDKFTLLPVRDDYAENIVKDRINIIDWINLDANRLYDISRVMEDIKAEIGRGIAIVVLQKGEGTMARGGQFTKDFTDCEILIDRFSEVESLLTIGKVKEYTQPVIGRTFAFGIKQGIKISNFREMKKCPKCYGRGFAGSGRCDTCDGRKFVDK